MRKPEGPAYYALLVFMGVVILGPLSSLVATYQNFKLGFYDAGNILVGALASVIVVMYGKKAMHGANYVQTLAASFGTMAGAAAIIQAMFWLEMPQPNPWLLVLLICAASNYGMGLGMMTTPLLIDKWQLPFPGAKAVADTLRSLSDRSLLKRSLGTLGGGSVMGFLIEAERIRIPLPTFAAFELASFCSGLLVGARLTVPAFLVAEAARRLTPFMVEINWLTPRADGSIPEPRTILFLPGLMALLGQATVDLGPLLVSNLKRFFTERRSGNGSALDKETKERLIWSVCWGMVLVLIEHTVFGVPIHYILITLLMAGFFVLANGIAVGLANQNPISSAFVLTLMTLVVVGLRNPMWGLICSANVFLAVATGTDMQADRSTGWRIGSSRRMQWYFHMIGTTIGPIFAVFIPLFFIEGNPVLKTDAANAAGWSSAMTLKIASSLAGIGHYTAAQSQALILGLIWGLSVALIRKYFRVVREEGGQPSWFKDMSRTRNKVMDWVLDLTIFASPYAVSFGLFLPYRNCLWLGIGGVVNTVYGTALKNPIERGLREEAERAKAEGREPEGSSLLRDALGLVASGGFVGGAIAAAYLTAKSFFHF